MQVGGESTSGGQPETYARLRPNTAPPQGDRPNWLAFDDCFSFDGIATSGSYIEPPPSALLKLAAEDRLDFTRLARAAGATRDGSSASGEVVAGPPGRFVKNGKKLSLCVAIALGVVAVGLSSRLPEGVADENSLARLATEQNKERQPMPNGPPQSAEPSAHANQTAFKEIQVSATEPVLGSRLNQIERNQASRPPSKIDVVLLTQLEVDLPVELSLPNGGAVEHDAEYQATLEGLIEPKVPTSPRVSEATTSDTSGGPPESELSSIAPEGSSSESATGILAGLSKPAHAGSSNYTTTTTAIPDPSSVERREELAAQATDAARSGAGGLSTEPHEADVNVLLKRAGQLLALGDIGGARLFLDRARTFSISDTGLSDLARQAEAVARDADLVLLSRKSGDSAR